MENEETDYEPDEGDSTGCNDEVTPSEVFASGAVGSALGAADVSEKRPSDEGDDELS